MEIDLTLKKHLLHLGNLGFFTTYRTYRFFELLRYHHPLLEPKVNISFKGARYAEKVTDREYGEYILDKLILQIDNKEIEFDEWGRITKCSLENKTQQVLAVILFNLERYMIHSLFRTYFFKTTMSKKSNFEEYINMIFIPLVIEFFNFIESDFNKLEPYIHKDLEIKKKVFFGLFNKQKVLDLKINDNEIRLNLDKGSINIPLIKFDRIYFTKEYKERTYFLNYYNNFDSKYNKILLPRRFNMDPMFLGSSCIFFSEYYHSLYHNDTKAEYKSEKNKFENLKQKIMNANYSGDIDDCKEICSIILCAMGSYIAKEGNKVIVLNN